MQGEQVQLISCIKSLKMAASRLRNGINIELKVHDLLLAISEYILQSDPTDAMEEVIGGVLQKLVNPNIIAFNIETCEKRNQLETKFSLTREILGHEIVTDLLDESGGGASDVAFLLVRILQLIHHPSKPRPILFADEPIKNLSCDRRDDFMLFLKKILGEFDMQLVLVTHEKEYIRAANTVVEFMLKGEKTIGSC